MRLAAVGASCIVAAFAAWQLLYVQRATIRMRWWLKQRWLRLWLVEHDLVHPQSIRRLGGVDISFVKGSETDACAALVVLDADTLTVLYSSCRRIVLREPYVPGYLAFREVGFLVELLAELQVREPNLEPDVILVDGNGILHPNRFGLACHLGVLSGKHS